MKYSIKALQTFEKEAKRLGKRYPSLMVRRWPAQNTHAYHSKGKGKSGGARVITFNVIIAVDETEINLLYLYDKSERSSITTNEIEELLQKNGLK